MRVYGRVIDVVTGKKVWTEVSTTPDGFNDGVYLTALIQALKLNLNESPFHADYGIPAQASVVQQIFPDWYVWQTQRQYAPFFASLIIAKEMSSTPTYRINVTTAQGYKLQTSIPA